MVLQRGWSTSHERFSAVIEHKPTNDFLLVVYDTQRVSEINRRSHYKGHKKLYPSLPAKYALLVRNLVSGDIHIFAQELRSAANRDQAVWFDTWANLDAAMVELRKRHPEEELVDKIGFVVDWPWTEQVEHPIHLQVGDYRTRRPEWRMVVVRKE